MWVLKRAVKQEHAAAHFKRVARLRSLAVAVVCLEFSRRQTSSMSQWVVAPPARRRLTLGRQRRCHSSRPDLSAACERLYDSLAPRSWLRGHWQWLMPEETGVSERKYVRQLTAAETIRKSPSTMPQILREPQFLPDQQFQTQIYTVCLCYLWSTI